MKRNKYTFAEVRKMFWEIVPQDWKKEYRVRKHQNEYPTDIRCAFVDFVDSLCKDGEITEKQADNITLG